jgi:hypothetical protein
MHVTMNAPPYIEIRLGIGGHRLKGEYARYARCANVTINTPQ